MLSVFMIYIFLDIYIVTNCVSLIVNINWVNHSLSWLMIFMLLKLIYKKFEIINEYINFISIDL